MHYYLTKAIQEQITFSERAEIFSSGAEQTRGGAEYLVIYKV